MRLCAVWTALLVFGAISSGKARPKTEAQTKVKLGASHSPAYLRTSTLGGVAGLRRFFRNHPRPKAEDIPEHETLSPQARAAVTSMLQRIVQAPPIVLQEFDHRDPKDPLSVISVKELSTEEFKAYLFIRKHAGTGLVRGKEFGDRFVELANARARKVLNVALWPKPHGDILLSPPDALSELVDEARKASGGHAFGTFLQLERMRAAVVADNWQFGAAKPSELQMAYLEQHLASAKQKLKPQVQRFLASRRVIFSEANAMFDPIVSIADESGNSDFRGAAKLQAKVDDALTILRGVVHPELLRHLRVVVLYRKEYRLRENMRDRTATTMQIPLIEVGPNTTVATILHELGHAIEIKFEGTGVVFAAATGFLANRAGSPYKLTEVSSAYGEEEVAFRGFTGVNKKQPASTPYKLKQYLSERTGGIQNTEVISTGLEALASEESAMQLFENDPEHLFLTLAALQRSASDFAKDPRAEATRSEPVPAESGPAQTKTRWFTGKQR